MRRRLGLPLAASIAGHGCILALLILLLGRTPLPTLLIPPQQQGVEVMLAPAEPIPPPQPPAPPPPPVPPPPIVAPQPPPPPVVEQKPPPPAPPEHRVVVRPPPRRPPPREPRREMVEPQYQPPPLPAYQQPVYQPPPPTYQAPVYQPPQMAAVPRPATPPPRPPGPLVSGAYRAELNAWLASHKRYPESARARSEEGGATLRFRVDRSGRVLSYSLLGSTGYPDLDASIDEMMRGAVLPPFPSDMTASDVEVTVPIHFRLER